jgi:nucleoside-diphosphate-sugar epimerase
LKNVLILGCGYTGQRVARHFLDLGHRVMATTRDPAKLAHIKGLEIVQLPASLPKGTLVLHSIPPAGGSGILEKLGNAPKRLVYISSTAVYGATMQVDQHTPTHPDSAKAQARYAAEQYVLKHYPSSLILRPAAIYGPGRGVQESIKVGAYTMGDNFVSRIHVDDLAAICEAALLSGITGAYPVSDDEPCTTREIGEFCLRLLNIEPFETREVARVTSNRRVDGSAIRRLLGVTLKYPSYRLGIPAALTNDRV